jgi:hypothetical protein
MPRIAFALFLMTVFASTVLALTGSQSAMGQDAATLAKWLPPGANTLGVIRVEDILKSPRAVREKWVEDYEARFLGGADVVPPWISTVVRASHANPQLGTRNWLGAVLQSTRPVNLDKIAEREDSTLTKIGERSAVFMPRSGGYVVELGPKTAGFLSPASRQDVRRWLTAVEKPDASPQLSPYLASLLASRAPVVVGIDLEDALELPLLKVWLATTQTMSGKDADRGAVEKALTSLIGVKLEITLGDATEAAIVMDFSSPIGTAGRSIKSLFLEILADQGALLPEFESSRTDIRTNSVALRTELSDPSLRKLLELLLSSGAHREHSNLSHDAAPQPATPVPSPAATSTAAVDANRKYYLAINRIVDDLQQRDRRATNYTKTAVFHDSAADKISRMSIKGIDPLLSDYAAEVSNHLRALASSLRGQTVAINAGNQSVVYNAQVEPGYSGFGWGIGFQNRGPTVNINSNLAEVRQKQAAAVERGAEQRDQIWESLLSRRETVRRALLDKFQVDFDEGKPGAK